MMTSREVDMLVFGFSVGSLASLWLGYELRRRVERWRGGRVDHRPREQSFPVLPTAERRQRETPVVRPSRPRLIPFMPIAAPGVKAAGNEAGDLPRAIRDEAVAALTSAGYKKVAAVVAVDACAPAERGTLESWVVAALRRATKS